METPLPTLESSVSSSSPHLLGFPLHLFDRVSCLLAGDWFGTQEVTVVCTGTRAHRHTTQHNTTLPAPMLHLAELHFIRDLVLLTPPSLAHTEFVKSEWQQRTSEGIPLVKTHIHRMLVMFSKHPSIQQAGEIRNYDERPQAVRLKLMEVWGESILYRRKDPGEKTDHVEATATSSTITFSSDVNTIIFFKQLFLE